LAIVKLHVFLGFQADLLFHLPSSLWRRFAISCLILSSSAFRVIATETLLLRGAAEYSFVSRLRLC
jgi:hypothetical protein